MKDNKKSSGEELAEAEQPEANLTRVVRLPLIGEAERLLQHVSGTSSVGAITGPNGTGKTETLKVLQKRYGELGLPGTAFRMSCAQQTGASRGIKDILLEIGAGGSFFQAGVATPVSLLCKAALKFLRQREIQCLLLDEANRWDSDALAGLVTLLNYLTEKDHPTCTILVGDTPTAEWIGQVPSLDSRTLRVLDFANLTTSMIPGLLYAWGGELAQLVERFEARDKEAEECIGMIYASTAGNLRRLRYLAWLLVNQNAAIGYSEVKSAVKDLAT